MTPAGKQGRGSRRPDAADKLLAGGSLAKEIAHTVNRWAAAETVVRAVRVGEMLPLGEPVVELGILQIDNKPELYESSSQHPFDLYVEMGCTWPDRPELDAPVENAVLHPIGKELVGSSVCMH